MSNIPEELKYTESHEWVSLDADGWLYSVSLADAGELEGLMDAEAYAESLEK